MQILRDVETSDHCLAMLVTTEHGDFTAMTAIHQRQNPRRQGGVRFVERGTLDEVARLAVGMTEKCRAAGVPLDGLKGLIVGPVGRLDTEGRAELLAEHVRQVSQLEPEVVYGPDMGCPEAVLDQVAERHGLGAKVTGLSRRLGGLDIDGNGLTAVGLQAALQLAPAYQRDCAVAIQGFGAVGANLARLVDADRAKVVAVSNVRGALIEESGLDVAALYALWRHHGEDGLAAYAKRHRRARWYINPSELFEVRADVLVPAARTSALALTKECPALREENPEVRPVEPYLRASGIRLIVEGANHPLSLAAEAWCEAQGALVFPDVLVNCGGMIGCWYEYQHREELLHDPSAYTAALEYCRRFIVERIRVNCGPIVAEGLGAAAARDRALTRPAGSTSIH